MAANVLSPLPRIRQQIYLLSSPGEILQHAVGEMICTGNRGVDTAEKSELHASTSRGGVAYKIVVRR